MITAHAPPASLTLLVLPIKAARLRWIGVWSLIALWLVALAFNIGGNLAHLLLVAAIALLVYQLLAEEPED